MARTSKAVQEIRGILQPDDLAAFVTNKYVSWRGEQQKWIEEHKELRNYIFQTDTTQTTNAKLPWKNKTSLPKLTQLRDNLHANYMAAMFPNDYWFKWEAEGEDGNTADIATKIEAYMSQKIRESEFKKVMSRLVYDYIDSGNAFGEVGYVNEFTTNSEGVTTKIYNGPMVYRLSPYDHYFDLTAATYKDAGKITRRMVSYGSLLRAAEEDPNGFDWVEDAVKNSLELRTAMSAYGDSDIDKSEGLMNDGLGSLSAYFSGDMIELLEFEGDLYDPTSETLLNNHRVIIVDRKKVVSSKPIDSWIGRSNKEHVGWRERPDNLLAAGPLDNLVGMQYRLDHLENLKADVFDQIAHPVVAQKGTVEDWEWGPGERIFMDVDADVQILRPDATALNADFQIQQLMQHMEELAGAPKQAMGIRTPGEKTAFEVQALENAAGRIFQQKVQKFEEEFVEPLLNQMLESARRNLGAAEQVKVLDDDFAVTQFLTIKKEDLNSKGKLRPIGARHFAQQAQIVQNLLGLVNSGAYQDPAVNAHISGKKIAKLFEENLGLQKHELVQDNIRIAEQQNTQSLAAQSQENVVSEVAERQAQDDIENEVDLEGL